MHFGAKFSYIFRCIRSIRGAAAPPVESATRIIAIVIVELTKTCFSLRLSI